MKIAHLILAHAEPSQLARLVDRLQHKDAVIFIHIDAKANIEPFEDALSKSGVHFVQDRVAVSWGAYSIIQATVNGFKSIIEISPEVGMINLLSGSDYPLKTGGEIANFFSGHANQNFMEFLSVQDEWHEAIPRLTEYHLTNFSFPGRYFVQKWLNKIMPRRKLPNGLVAVGRSQWMSLTTEAVRYIIGYLNNNPNVVRFFKLTWAPDEIIFQTILYNSIFKDKLVNNNLRYIDWAAGKASPKTLDIEDLSRLVASDRLFARKFDLKKQPEILDQLDGRLR